MEITLKKEIDTNVENNEVGMPLDIFLDKSLKPESLMLLMFLTSATQSVFSFEQLSQTLPSTEDELMTAIHNLNDSGYIQILDKA
ncbi:hypothetical protein [Alkalihalobacillus pseudalcaliphilus]|uniref:hypothetical protein n=1 Tax=Alkalihalobacillus pseudalcaliphilus TaxID=79884 RepID=UPI00064DFDF3|nr:hypothetical protein [Alkalihalobacillus pseudalcaliphilus]KMK76550.1 hypothetical protein AB990_15380 [Alkalihalobacillus pseudalcaliphilus]